MRRLLLICLPLLISSIAFSQNDQLLISDILFEGNTKTKADYLQRFIKCKKGSTPDSLLVAEDIRLLRSLTGVMNVDYKLDTVANGLVLKFLVQERFTLLPLADFGVTNEGYWFGLGAFDANLAGRGIYLYAFYRYYERHSLITLFRVPYLFNSKWGMDINISRWATVEPLYRKNSTANYNFDYINAEILARYEFRPEHEIKIGGGLLLERYKRLEIKEDYDWPEEVNKSKTVLKINHQKRRLDLFYFYLRGWSNETRLETVLSNNGTEDPFILFQNSFKYFARIGPKINIGVRNILGLATNRDSPFSPFVLDSYQNIRGVGERVDRGSGTIILNLEYRHTLYENKLGGIQGVAFTDLGTWRKPGGSFSDFTDRMNIKTHGGLGLRLIYKKAYGAVLSIDYGLNLQDHTQGGWVIGVGQYF